MAGSELKPVNCGCGGEAYAGEVHFWGRCYTVQCSECGIETEPQNTEAEAIQAWNKAMSAERIEWLAEYATGLQTEPERSAIVENQESTHGYWMGDCSECKNSVDSYMNYCPQCGARLEWK